MDFLSLSHIQVLEFSSKFLGDTDHQLETIRNLLERLTACENEANAEEEAKQILRLIATSVYPLPAITEMVFFNVYL